MRSTRIIATTLTKSSGVWSYRVVHIGYVLPRTWEPEAVPGVVCLLHIPGMYQESAAEGPADVHTSHKKLILAIFRWVCTRVPHCRALSVYMSGMCTPRERSKRSQPDRYTPDMYSSAAGCDRYSSATGVPGGPASPDKTKKRHIPGMYLSLWSFSKGLHVKQEMYIYPFLPLMLNHIARNKIKRVTNG